MAMTGYGLTQRDIATFLEIDGKTLRAHYRRELDTGAIEANARVVESLYRNATKNDNVAAQIWWTKARMGWKDTSRIENTGPDGGALQVDFRWADAPDAPALEAPQDAIEWADEPPKGHAD